MEQERTPSEAWPAWVEQWILPYLEDMSLWPVLVAVLGHVLVVLVPLELAFVRGPNLAALAVLSVLLVVTAEVVRMELRALGRPRWLTLIAVGMWAASVPCAYYAGTTGIL